MDGLSFLLSSSDTDSVGRMRTPAYFCLDDIISYWPTGGGIHEVYQNGLFKIYPNPVASGTQLFFENQTEISLKEYTVTLYNLSGEKVLQEKATKSLTLAQLPPGIYTLLMRNSQQQPVNSMIENKCFFMSDIIFAKNISTLNSSQYPLTGIFTKK